MPRNTMRFLSFPAICTLIAVAAAQDLAFLSPRRGDVTHYDVDEEVSIQWQTPFESTNLEVWQGPNEGGSFAMRTLIGKRRDVRAVLLYADRRVANTTGNTFHWKAQALDGMTFHHDFHFRLQKGSQPNFCTECSANSETFYLSTLSNLPNAPQARAMSPEMRKSTGGGLSTKDRVGLAVGLGIGIALLTASLTVLLLIRKSRRQVDEGKQKEHSQRSAKELDAHAHWIAETCRSSTYAPSCTTVSTNNRPKSYLEAFEFQDIDGSIREGWSSLFGGVHPAELPPRPRPAASMYPFFRFSR